MTHYNSWPLGRLPKEWQRPEPDLIKKAGYHWDDARDIIDLFESKLAEYAGSKYAVAVDCCTNGIYLCLRYREVKANVIIPSNTYVSIPMQIIHAGAKPVFKHIEWSGIYELGDTGIIDGAARYTRGMYVGNDSLQVLSFQIKKRLPIGKGGAILTDSLEAYNWLKLASYDGRDLNSPYDSFSHVQSFGWHYYMTPEDAARGILLMDGLPEINEDTMDWKHYPNLEKMDIFKNMQGDK